MARLIAKRFEIGGLIGQGGMGEVYRGLDRLTGQVVAIKMLKPDFVREDPDMVERFTREGEALRQLNHPNIVSVLATFQDGQHHCIIMDFVTGGSLADLLRQQPQQPIERVLRISLELADALTRAHHLKIIHRDIKPANVLLADDGTARLTDFGVARIGDSNLTQIGTAMGTFAYLSPEACRGEPIDGRTDIWSFGVMLYEMLAGQRPYEEIHSAALVTAILTKPIPPLDEIRPDTPVALLDLIYRMLEKNLEARIPRMRMVGAELEAIIDMLESHVQPITLRDLQTSRVRFDSISTPAEPETSRVIASNNLPAFTTPFIGRIHELTELNRLLRDARLITILGAGGMGKTRVAVAAAEQQLGIFTDGVYYVSLAAINDSTLLPSTIAESIKFTFGGADSPQNQLINYLREKRMLLILDNFEHLINGANIVTDILQAASNVTIVVVSRERLRLQGETLFDLYGLSYDSDDNPPAIELFKHSAARLIPDFEVTPDNLPTLRHICKLVDGMPLGIELAAAWLEAVSLEEIVIEIEKSLDFLETDLRDVPERHRSLRAVFESSWQLLSNEERASFMKLSVFRDGFTREAAERVAKASLRTLITLVNKSILKRTADGRYWMPILLRQYGEEQLNEAPDVAYQVYHAHAVFYAEFMQKIGADFNTPKERKAVDAAEVEIENVRCAWCWALENQVWDLLSQTLLPLHGYYLLRSLLNESQNVFNQLAETLVAHGQESSLLYWQARTRQAAAAGSLGDYDLLARTSQAALTYYHEHEVTFEICHALNNLAYAHMMQGRYQESRQTADESARLARSLDQLEVLLTAIGHRGYAEFLMGDYASAKETYQEFNELARTKGSPISYAFGLNNLGEILSALGVYQEVKPYYEEAYKLFKSYGHRRGMAFTLGNLGGCLFAEGDYKRAIESYQESYALNKGIGDRAGIGHSLSALGNVAMIQGNYTQAKRYYEESLVIRRTTGDQRRIADSLYDLATTELAAQNFDSAATLLKHSLTIRQEIGDQLGENEILLGLGVIALAKHNANEVYEYFQQALENAQKMGQRLHQSLALSGVGTALFWREDYEASLENFRESLKIAYQDNIIGVVAFALLGFSNHLRQQKCLEQAVELLSFIQHHPTPGDWTNMAKRQVDIELQQLESELRPALFRAAQERGRYMTLDAIMELGL